MAEKDTNKVKKPSKIGTWFKNLRSEFKKITWATPKDTSKSFAVVLVGIVVCATLIGLFDWGLSNLFEFLLKTF